MATWGSIPHPNEMDIFNSPSIYLNVFFVSDRRRKTHKIRVLLERLASAVDFRGRYFEARGWNVSFPRHLEFNQALMDRIYLLARSKRRFNYNVANHPEIEDYFKNRIIVEEELIDCVIGDLNPTIILDPVDDISGHAQQCEDCQATIHTLHTSQGDLNRDLLVQEGEAAFEQYIEDIYCDFYAFPPKPPHLQWMSADNYILHCMSRNRQVYSQSEE